VQQPRGRRIGELLRYSARVVADQRGQSAEEISAFMLAAELGAGVTA
jgi:hypothetical protein